MSYNKFYEYISATTVVLNLFKVLVMHFLKVSKLSRFDVHACKRSIQSQNDCYKILYSKVQGHI